MSARPWLAGAGAAVAIALVVALGVRWQADRARAYDAPALDPRRLVRLADDPAPRAHVERWVVALHPGCPHCTTSLAHVAEARAARDAPVRLAALIVDWRTAPERDYWQALPLEEVWWDSAGDWRSRWGHRVYGEVMCFDRSGRLLRTLPPFRGDAAEAAKLPSPQVSHQR